MQPLRVEPLPVREAPVPAARTVRDDVRVTPDGLVERIRRGLFLRQIVAMALLAGLHAAVTWVPQASSSSLAKLVDVDYEMNLPTWFASLQLALLALTLVAITMLVSRSGRRLGAFLWSGCAAAAFYLAADEVGAIHERLGGILEHVLLALPPGSLPGFLLEFRSYYWMLAYAPVFVPAIAILLVFVWKELGSARRQVLLGVFVFLYAAVGLDYIEGRWGNPDHTRMVFEVGSRTVRFDIFLMEEILEMLGVALILDAFLRHLSVLVSRARGSPNREAPIDVAVE